MPIKPFVDAAAKVAQRCIDEYEAEKAKVAQDIVEHKEMKMSMQGTYYENLRRLERRKNVALRIWEGLTNEQIVP